MHLAVLKIWNFRKYGVKNGENEESPAPGLIAHFESGLNLLVGENDSGKSAIIDALKHVLLTQSYDSIRLEEEDFYKPTFFKLSDDSFEKLKEQGLPEDVAKKLQFFEDNEFKKDRFLSTLQEQIGQEAIEKYQKLLKDHAEQKVARTTWLKIECIFRNFIPEEASHFLEWIGFDEKEHYELKVRLIAKYKDYKLDVHVTAGPDEVGTKLDGNARNLLRVTYLKPLRDAEAELSPGYRSRLAQILKSHELFQKDKGEKHVLELYVNKTNDKIKEYFKIDKFQDEEREVQEKDKKKFTENDYYGIMKGTKGAKPLMNDLTNTLGTFLGTDDANPFISISGNELSAILNRLSLDLEENKAGLGSLNLLFIAAELLLLQKEDNHGLRLALIEEIEAHLHPQAQLRLIEYLQNDARNGQYILTTHSTTLSSKVSLKHLLVCKDEYVFPMKEGSTQLERGDYKFLERFLDATKANLFFAKGIILVEGDAENLLIPTVAEILDRPLHKYGISIVNVGSTAFLRYAKIFLRKDSEEADMGIPVAIITDLDILPIEYYEEQKKNVPTKCEFVYKITDTDISSLAEILNDTDSTIINGKPLNSKTAFEEDLRKAKIPVKARSQIVEIAKKEISPADIEYFKQDKLHQKQDEYAHSSLIKAFIAKNWTLEYEIALSGLKKELYEAILCAESIQKNNAFELSPVKQSEFQEKVNNDFDSWNTLFDTEIAYCIYTYLLNRKISKAITAQYLAQILKDKASRNADEKDELKKKIEEDPYLAYLCDAIYHVTGRK